MTVFVIALLALLAVLSGGTAVWLLLRNQLWGGLGMGLLTWGFSSALADACRAAIGS